MQGEGQDQDQDQDEGEGHDRSTRRESAGWADRRLLSWHLRGLVLLAPLAASMTCGLVFAAVVARPDGAAQLSWWIGLLAVSVLSLVVVERAARRLLPLAALLRLTLVFPDHAPSRLGVALRTLNTRRMRKWATQLAADSDSDSDELAARATAVLSLAAALSAHDRRTRGHSERVGALTALVAQEMGLDDETRRNLQWAAILHDIGKLTVPKEILNKTGSPNQREWALLELHPGEGARIAAPLEVWLGASAGAIAEHHEKYDGTGYPLGLAGTDISLSGRLVGVTDAFETMTAVRSYKRPMSVANARTELARCSGSHFDPDIVRAFLNVSLGRLHWKVGVASWIAQIPLVGVLPRAGAQIGAFTGGSAASGAAVAGVATFVVGAGMAISGLSVPEQDINVVLASAERPAVSARSDSAAPRGNAGSRTTERDAAATDTADTSNTARSDSVPDRDADTPSDDPTSDDPPSDDPPKGDPVDGMPSAGTSTPPNLAGTPPGDAPVLAVAAPTPPGQINTPPGHGGTPPGQTNTPPGHGGTPPGQTNTPPGHGGTPPGQTNTPPGHGGTPPGQINTPPGLGGTPPGQINTPPGLGGTPPGQAKK